MPFQTYRFGVALTSERLSEVLGSYYVPSSQRGIAGGIAELDVTSLLKAAQRPPAEQTVEVLAEVTVGAGIATVQFNAIPQTYTDLMIMAFVGNASGNTSLAARCNGDSTFGDYQQWSGDADKAKLSQGDPIPWAGNPNSGGGYQILIPKYRAAQWKAFIGSSGGVTPSPISAVWKKVAALTSLSLFLDNGASFNAGNTFTLYGIKDV